ncbi:MAG TPA: hypothetical protein VFQ77_08065 [Pseudonocardiaceae bacterium]|jgi:hypothetical protein|nr:hypothetical protein [Pseudonocardiaceae bacterium]
MTDHQPGATDLGPRCVCGHPEHPGHCWCGCRSYICAGPHPDQSRGGVVPAVVVLVTFAVLVGTAVAVLVLRALW